MIFDPEASYWNFDLEKLPTPKIPKEVKALDFKKLDKYK